MTHRKNCTVVDTCTSLQLRRVYTTCILHLFQVQIFLNVFTPLSKCWKSYLVPFKSLYHKYVLAMINWWQNKDFIVTLCPLTQLREIDPVVFTLVEFQLRESIVSLFFHRESIYTKRNCSGKRKLCCKLAFY